MIEADLPAVAIPLETGAARQRQTVPASQSELAEILQPVRAQPWVIQFDWLPVDFLQFPAHQHRADGRLPDGSHAFPNEFCRVLLQIPFLEQVLQFLLAILIQPYGEPFPAQGDGITGDKDKLPAIFLEDTSGAALAPAVKALHPYKTKVILLCQLLHKGLFLLGEKLVKLRTKQCFSHVQPVICTLLRRRWFLPREEERQIRISFCILPPWFQLFGLVCCPQKLPKVDGVTKYRPHAVPPGDDDHRPIGEHPDVLHFLPAEHSRTDAQHLTGVPIDELGKVIGEDLTISLHQQPIFGKPAKFQPLAHAGQGGDAAPPGVHVQLQ